MLVSGIATSRDVPVACQPERSLAIRAASRTFWSSRRSISSIEVSSVLTSITSSDPVSGWDARTSIE
ncbi:MAG: hypothetical protein ACRDGI_02850, partial [Candidatus Limnocylindrales bacterium]